MSAKSVTSEAIKAGMRRFIAEEGRAVQFEESYFAGATYDRVSPYGWSDYTLNKHASTCGGWVLPKGVVIAETSYSRFVGTFVGNEEEVGLNAPGCQCACGKYQNVTLRVTSSLGDAIKALVGYDSTREMEL